MTEDPQVIGRLEGSNQDYGGPLYALPDFAIERPQYEQDDLWRFRVNSEDADNFNNALISIGDRSLTAEVHRYREASTRIAQLQRDIDQLQNQMWEAGALLSGSARCLEGAGALERIAEEWDKLTRHRRREEQDRRGERGRIPRAVRRGRRS
jgi:hypothetical protein